MSEQHHRDAPEALRGPVAGLFQRITDWWRQPTDFTALPDAEMDRIAGELGMTRQGLADLAAQGPHATDLLYRRMAELGLGRADVDRVAFGLIRELEKSCACCGDKDRCTKDLESRPHDRAWANYCPNAVSLDAIEQTKGRFPA